MAVCQITNLEESLHNHNLEDDENDFGFFPLDDEEDDTNNSNDARKEQQPLKECKEEEDDEQPPSVISASDASSSSSSNSTENNPNSSGGFLPLRRKSSLKSISSYSTAEGEDGDVVPLNFGKRQSSRVLPIPSYLLAKGKTKNDGRTKTIVIPTRHSLPTHGTGGRKLFSVPSIKGGKGKGSSMKRCTSDACLVRSIRANDDFNDDDSDADGASNKEESENSEEISSATDNDQPSMGKKKISFGTIAIREHSLTCGDNPSVSYGTPLTLDWTSEDMEEIKVDDYEAYRQSDAGAVRTNKELMLNYYQRKDLLAANGCTIEEITKTKKLVNKTRSKREFTKFLAVNYPMVQFVEDVFESGARKVKRAVGGKSSSNNKNSKNADESSVINTSIHRSKPYCAAPFDH